jgi:hypothetical protein
MLFGTSTIAALAVTSTTVVVLVCSVLLLNRLRQWGTLERALAHTVIDTTSRRALLLGIGTLAGTFVALSAMSIAANLQFVSDAVNDAITTALFCSGAVALLYMIYNGFRVSRLTLEDELTLRDFEPAVFDALTGPERHGEVPGTSLYVAPPIDGGTERPLGGPHALLR